MRYRCTAGKCMQYEATTNDSSLYTLIMRKNTQIARAADPLTGTEKCIHKYINNCQLDGSFKKFSKL